MDSKACNLINTVRTITVPWLEGVYTLNEFTILTGMSTCSTDAALNVLLPQEPKLRELLGTSVDFVKCVTDIGPITLNNVEDERWWDKEHKNLLLGRAIPQHISVSRMHIVPRFCFSLLIYLMPQCENDIIYVITKLRLNSKLYSVESYVEKTKLLSTTAKKYRDKFHKHWDVFCEWNQFVGYSFDKHIDDDEEMIYAIKSWLQDETVTSGPTWDDDFSLYYSIFGEVLYNWLSKAASKRIGHMLRNWLLNTADWVTSGSSQGESSMVWVAEEGQWVKSRKVKAVLSLNHTVDEFISILHNTSQHEGYTVAHKIEPGQPGRLIVGASAFQNMRLAFISSWIESGLKETFKESTLYMNNKLRVAFHEKLVAGCRLDKLIKFPADYSKFDQRVSADEVNCVFTILESLAAEHWNKEYLSVLQRARALFYNVPVYYKTGIVCMARSGLPSGTRWTAMLGTLINAARMHTMFKLCSENAFGFGESLDTCFQGDDSTVTLTRWVDVAQLIGLCEGYSMGINPLKNFVSLTSNDFLRKFYSTKGKIGLISRRLVKICFRDPLKTDNMSKSMLVRERMKSIMALVGRGANVARCTELAIRDVKIVSKSAIHLDNWLHTPVAAGGVGFQPLSVDNWYRSEEAEMNNAFEVVVKGVQSARLAAANERIGFVVSGTFLRAQLGTTLVDTTNTLVKKALLRLGYDKLKLIRVEPIGKLPMEDETQLLQIALGNYGSRFKDFRLRPDLVYLPTEEHVAVLVGNGAYATLGDLLHPDILPFWEVFSYKCDVKVVRDWVNGKLEMSTPFLPHLDVEVVAVVTASIWGYMFDKMLKSRARVTSLSVNKLKLVVESMAAMALIKLYSFHIYNQYN